jgi:hypothetical protein
MDWGYRPPKHRAGRSGTGPVALPGLPNIGAAGLAHGGHLGGALLGEREGGVLVIEVGSLAVEHEDEDENDLAFENGGGSTGMRTRRGTRRSARGAKAQTKTGPRG